MKTLSRISATLAAAVLTVSAAAQTPLYIVNGVETDDIRHIPSSDIVSVEELPADEQTVARYGAKANNGVYIVTLRYDAEARFNGGESFSEYVASHVVWDDDEPVARVVLRYEVNERGCVEVLEILESTDSRLRRRVLKAVAAAPAWEPATKDGRAVASQHILRVQLPAGREMPRERVVIML